MIRQVISGGHVVEVGPEEIQYKNSLDYQLEMSPISIFTTVYIYTKNSHKRQMLFQVLHKENENGETVLHLNHLETKDEYEGVGFGKLCLGIFDALCRIHDAKKFSIKFGGGEKSSEFLQYLGFDKEVIHHVEGSVIVGRDYELTEDEFKIEPLSIEFLSSEKWHITPVNKRYDWRFDTL